MKPAIVGLSGPALTPQEKELFAKYPPFGFILFTRNCQDPIQLKALIQELHEAVPHTPPILIDQEGGRVQRLQPPHWLDFPPAASYETLGIERLRQDTLDMAQMLKDQGITVNCSPCLDVLNPQGHGIIGDRAYSSSPQTVAALGVCVTQAFLDGGITPVIKHIPGHGRAPADSHLDLPVVKAPLEELQKDWYPFRVLASLFPKAWAMTAHVIYETIDPLNPATISQKIIQEVIREQIGFTGLLITDCLSMKALKYNPCDSALKAFDAGCDIALYCPGDLEGTEEVLKTI